MSITSTVWDDRDGDGIRDVAAFQIDNAPKVYVLSGAGGAGTSADGKRVLIPGELIDKTLAAAPRSFNPEKSCVSAPVTS